MRGRSGVAKHLLLIFVLFCGLCAGYWIHLERSFRASRAAALDDGRLRAEQIAEAARQQFAATFRGMDYLLRDARATFARSPGALDVSAPQTLSLLPPSAEAYLGAYDADGRLIAASGDGGHADDNIADTTYFQQVKAGAARDPMVVGQAEFNPRPGRWSIPLARPILRNGAFAGAMVLALSPHYFSDELARIGLGPNDAIGAIHIPDGTYLARSSQIDRLVGRAIDRSRPYLKPGAPTSGVFISTATYEPDERLYAWARVPDLQVVLFVGLSVSDLLARVDQDIARDRRANLIGTGAVLALALALTLLAARDIRQRRALVRQEALYRALFDQNHSVKLISDPNDGRILAANAAASAFYGYSRERLTAMNIADINCLPREEIVACMAEAREGHRPSFIFPHRLASGEIRMVEVFSGPVDLEGSTALYSIIHDVTDRFELEKKLRESEKRYRTIFEAVPAGMLLVDRHGSIAAWNAAALSILHTDAEALVNRAKPVFDRHGQPLPLAQRPTVRCLAEDIREELIYTHDENGQRLWMSVNGRRLPPAPGGAPSGAIVTFSDITRAVQLEESLLISQLVFDSSAEGIMVTDLQGGILKVNAAFQAITGYPADEAIGRRPKLMSSGKHDPTFYRAMFESLATKKTWEGEITNRRKDGSLFVERAVISAIQRPDGVLSGYVVLLSDITERKQREEETWRRANFDALTGLPNRTLLADRIAQALAQGRRRDLAVGVLFIDLDWFKPVNDFHGHAAGDELLKQVAERIAAVVRAEDTVARLGGDEFVVLLPVVASEVDAAAVAAKILARLREPFTIAAGVVSISACIGVATDLGGTGDAATLVGRADAAMYLGKTAGRSQVILASGREDVRSETSEA